MVTRRRRDEAELPETGLFVRVRVPLLYRSPRRRAEAGFPLLPPRTGCYSSVRFPRLATASIRNWGSPPPHRAACPQS